MSAAQPPLKNFDVVVLGAGLDTRAHRMPELAGLHVYELDLPGASAFKQAQVRTHLGASPAHVGAADSSAAIFSAAASAFWAAAT